MFTNLETIKSLKAAHVAARPVHPLAKASIAEVTGDNLGEATEVQTMVAVFAAEGDIGTVAVFRQDGENYAWAKDRFFVSCVALYCYLGDDAARQVVRDTWADSKAAPREYALKIFRMCKAAAEKHGIPKIETVTGFAALQSLVPPREQAQAAADDANKAMNEALSRALTPEEKTAIEGMQQDTQSRLADIAATMDAFDGLVARMQALTDARSVKKSDVASLAGEFAAMRATFAGLLNVA